MKWTHRRRLLGVRVPSAAALAITCITWTTLTLLAGCGPGGTDRDGTGASAKGNPVILISVDTLRSDRLPAYGYEGVDTPAIDALRADGVLFERAYSPIPLTLPAHASILTGQLPPASGVRDNAGYRLEQDAGPTLPELLGAVGYATGAAVSAYPMRTETGLARGFDHYDDEIADVERALMANLQRPGGQTLERALEWLDTVDDGPFFLLFHIYEPHTPQEPPEPFASRYPDPYDGEVATADAVVGRLLDALRARGLYESSTILFLSDHGEGLGDHGEEEHGVLLYRESLQVPLILKLPGSRAAGTSVPQPTELTDVLPTVVELTGAAAPEGLPGTSLLRFVDGEVPPELADRVVYSETFHPQLRYGWSGLRSVIRGDHHYIEGVDRELYDLATDPEERNNILREDRRTYAALRDSLARFDSELEPPFEENTETRRALASLGYLGTSTATREGPLPDPKAMIVQLKPLRDGISLLRGRQPEEAIPLLLQAAEAIPESLDAWQFLGLAYQETGSVEEALDAYQKAFELSNGAPHLAQPLAELSLRLQRWGDAAAYLELAIENDPDDLRLRLFRTRALLFAGNLEQAALSAEETAAAAPENAEALYLLGAVRMGRRELDAAEGAYRKVLEIAPDYPPALSDLAVLLASQGRRQEAAALLEHLVEVQPDNRAARESLERLRGG